MNGRYSRRVAVADLSDLAEGDLVDVSTSSDACWDAVRTVGTCADDQDEDSDTDCDGCEAVIFFADSRLAPWHVGFIDTVYARFIAAADQAVIEAENTHHAEAAAARYQAAVAANARDNDLSDQL
jgi:hypothetical protein